VILVQMGEDHGVDRTASDAGRLQHRGKPADADAPLRGRAAGMTDARVDHGDVSVRTMDRERREGQPPGRSGADGPGIEPGSSPPVLVVGAGERVVARPWGFADGIDESGDLDVTHADCADRRDAG
jgi:hypothetical protein